MTIDNALPPIQPCLFMDVAKPLNILETWFTGTSLGDVVEKVGGNGAYFASEDSVAPQTSVDDPNFILLINHMFNLFKAYGYAMVPYSWNTLFRFVLYRDCWLGCWLDHVRTGPGHAHQEQIANCDPSI